MYKFLTKDELLSILQSAYAFELDGNIYYFSVDSVNDTYDQFALYNSYINKAIIFMFENAESETTKLYLYEKDHPLEKRVLTVLSQTIAADLIFPYL